MLRTIGYTYEADMHCADCTRTAAQRMTLDHKHPYAIGYPCKDDRGVEYDLVDSEGHLIHPVFNIDENPDWPRAQRCGDCFDVLA